MDCAQLSHTHIHTPVDELVYVFLVKEIVVVYNVHSKNVALILNYH